MAQDTPTPGNAMQLTRDYFDSLLIEMRHLDGTLPDTTLRLFGEAFSTPVMMAALSHLRRDGKNDMVAVAEGAKKAGALMWCGMGDEAELEDILAPGAKTVKIIKPYADRQQVYGRIAHAAASGALATGMDIDHQFGRDGRYDNVMGHEMLPVSAAELREFVAASPLPFIVKGVLSVQDAVKCADAGAAGIVLSHHNGLVPYAVPPLLVLPGIAAAVKGRLKIFVDCGVASGADVFKALALGADAVSVGKPMIAAVRERGADGVAEEIARITAELAGIMARTCTPDIAHVDASVIHPHW